VSEWHKTQEWNRIGDGVMSTCQKSLLGVILAKDNQPLTFLIWSSSLSSSESELWKDQQGHIKQR